MAESVTPRMGRLVIWVFAGVGLLAALAVIFLAVTVLGFRFAEREAAPIQAKTAQQVFAVAQVDRLEGTGLFQVVIATEASLGRSGYSKGYSADERNVILVDMATGANRKLLASNDRPIVERRYLPAAVDAEDGEHGAFLIDGADGKKQAVPAAYYLLRVRTADGKREDVLLGDLKTGRQAFVLTGIDGVDNAWMQTPTRLGFLLRKDRKLEYRAIEIPELKIVAARRIEID